MILVELQRQTRRLRTLIAFGALMALPTIVAIAERVSEPDPANLQERTLYAVSTASGLNHALASLTFMSQFFLVIVVVSFAGEAIAGEASWGTLRYLLIRPVSRGRVIRDKFIVLLILTALATLSIVAAGLISGTIAFGWREMLTPSFGTIAVGEGVLRLAAAFAYVTWMMAGVVAFAFLLSTFTTATSGATGGAIGLTIVSQILNAISAVDFLHPGLPTHYWNAWGALFASEGEPLADLFSTADMAKGAAVQAIYVTLFGGLAWWRFRRKDILS